MISDRMQNDDALDAHLWETGDIAGFLARWEATIKNYCLARLRGHADAEDVAQNVRMRLFREFQSGRSYPVPYRVVAFNVMDWTVKDYHAKHTLTEELPDEWASSLPDIADSVVSQFHIEGLIAGLPPREQEVARLRYIEHLEGDEIAERLGIERNNVYQVVYRVNARLRGEDIG